MKQKFANAFSLALIVAMLFTSVALASEVDVAVVDVTVPTNSVTLAPGASAGITINMSVTGNQVGTATFEVYRDWTLSGGTFTGSNPQEFTVGPRGGGDPATTFSTSGTVTIAVGQAEGPFTLSVGVFDITNSNPTGAKLAAGDPSNYQVTVSSPPPPSDTTAPEISYVLNPASPDGANGWYVSDVTLTWTVSEPESPGSLVLTGCINQTIIADQGATDYSCSASSDGGFAGPMTVTIKRDATAPSLSPSVSPNPVALNGSATASPNASDATSGVASSSCDSVDTSSVGSHSVSCTATDNAGNTISASANYSVVYNFGGFFQPVDNNTLNIAKAGQAIPLKWRLTDANGNPVLNLASVKVTVASLTCASGVTGDLVEEYAAGSSGLQNLGDGYYQFNWKTPTSYASSCKTMNLDLGDGVPHTAQFQFKK